MSVIWIYEVAPSPRFIYLGSCLRFHWLQKSFLSLGWRISAHLCSDKLRNYCSRASHVLRDVGRKHQQIILINFQTLHLMFTHENSHLLEDINYFLLYCVFPPSRQSYATLGRNNKNSITTCTASSSVYTSSPLGSPINQQLGGPSVNISHPMSVGLISPNQSIVTSTLNEFRFRPELLANSNRLQESCI